MTGLDLLWRPACDTCEIVGPVIVDDIEYLVDNAPELLHMDPDEGPMLRDAEGTVWPLWEDFATAHGAHNLALIPATRAGTERPRPGWARRFVHGPVPYDVDTASPRVKHRPCADGPGEDCGRIHDVHPIVQGPGRMAQRVACPACRGDQTQWYFNPKYGPFILCRASGCRLPSGPGAERHLAVAQLKQETPMMEELTSGALAVDGSGTYG